MSQRGGFAAVAEMFGLRRRREDDAAHADLTDRGWKVPGGGWAPVVEAAPEFEATSNQVCGLWPFAAGSALPGIAPSNAYACQDGWVLVAGNGDSIFKRLMTTIGRDDLGTAPDLADNAGRVARVGGVCRRVVKRVPEIHRQMRQGEHGGRVAGRTHRGAGRRDRRGGGRQVGDLVDEAGGGDVALLG